MLFAVLGIPLKQELGLNDTEFGLLAATPVLSGSLIRVPLGIWTDRFGGRIVMAALMAAVIPAIWLMAYATEFWHFLVIGPPDRPNPVARFAGAKFQTRLVVVRLVGGFHRET